MSNIHFRKTLSLTLAGALSAAVFLNPARGYAATEDTSKPELFSYEGSYKNNVANVCAVAWNPSGSLVAGKDFTYPDIGNSEDAERYREGVKSVGGDLTRINELLAGNGSTQDPFTFGKDIDRASEVYKERMNGIFACAQINFKIRTHERLLATIRGQKADSGNSAKQIEETTKRLRQEMARRKCADRTATEGKDNIMLKGDLLRQSTYEYCNYRHYLQYVKSNAQSRLAKMIDAEQKRVAEKNANAQEGEIKTTTSEALAGNVMKVAGSIDREIAHTREVFPQAMVAYNEFERTYASHVVALFVLEDYMLLRDSLKRVMNPLGQLIYKASNAQSPHSP